MNGSRASRENRRGWIIPGAVVVILASSSAHARVYDLYRSDAPKGAFCSAIAGACSADPELENGFYQNPASLTAGAAKWNFDLDYDGSGNLEPGSKGENSIQESTFSGGIGGSWENWGIGLGFVQKRTEVDSTVAVTDSLGLVQKFPLSSTSSSLDLLVPISRRVNSRLSVGMGVSASIWSLSLVGGNGSRAQVTRDSAPIRWGFRVGTYFHEPASSWSFGSWLRLPSTRYSHVVFDTQAYSNSLHYEEDVARHDPWVWATGARWTPWRDGKFFLLDLKFIGPTTDGYLLTYDTFATAFGESQLRAKGRSIVVEPRAGFQIPTHFRSGRKSTLLLGSFLESSRREGLGSRVHFTGGLSYEAISGFEFMIGGDIAKDFAQLFITFR